MFADTHPSFLNDTFPLALFSCVHTYPDLQHRNTFVRAHRPYGVSCIVAGFHPKDGGKPRIFATEPSGVVQEWLAVCIGERANSINHRLESHQNELKDMTAGQLARLAARAIMDAKETPLHHIELELVIMTLPSSPSKTSRSLWFASSQIQVRRMFIKSKEQIDQLGEEGMMGGGAGDAWLGIYAYVASNQL